MDYFRSGGMTVSNRSKVRKIPGLCLETVPRWLAQHPVLGNVLFDTWREAMDHANTRCYMFN